VVIILINLFRFLDPWLIQLQVCCIQWWNRDLVADNSSGSSFVGYARQLPKTIVLIHNLSAYCQNKCVLMAFSTSTASSQL